jgi:hypothetical protein
MYSVWIVERTYCVDYDVCTVFKAACESKRAAKNYVKTCKARKLEQCGEAWNDDFYYDGQLDIREVYLHTKGERP